MSSFKNSYNELEKIIYQDRLKIKALHFHQDLDMMLVVLTNGKVLQRRLSASERLKKAASEQLNDYRLIGQGAGVHWECVDEDLSLKGFLKEEIYRSIQHDTPASTVG